MNIRRSMTDLGIDEVCDANDMSASAVYWEIRNAARRYFENCKSPQYARKWFGMVATEMSEEARASYMRQVRQAKGKH